MEWVKLMERCSSTQQQLHFNPINYIPYANGIEWKWNELRALRQQVKWINLMKENWLTKRACRPAFRFICFNHSLHSLFSTNCSCGCRIARKQINWCVRSAALFQLILLCSLMKKYVERIINSQFNAPFPFHSRIKWN